MKHGQAEFGDSLVILETTPQVEYEEIQKTKRENMKFIIDLIEDVREQIGNHEEYIVTAGLLKSNENDSSKLTYAGEAALNLAVLDDESKQLDFKIDGSDMRVTIGALIPPLLILDMDTMMYELKMEVNTQYPDMDIVGFGKNDEQKKYILFIKI